MEWRPQEVQRLRPIVDRLAHDLGHPRDLVVACSGRGELAFELARRFPHARIVGFELDLDALAEARARSVRLRLDWRVEFGEAESARIPLPSGRFDGFVSDFVLYPTSTPTEFGQREIARVLKPGGRALITDVVTERPIEPAVKRELDKIGLDYVCEAARDDFHDWMTAAGMGGVQVDDLTPLIRPLWDARMGRDPDPSHEPAYAALLDREVGLGGEIFYIYVRGQMRRAPVARRPLTTAG